MLRKFKIYLESPKTFENLKSFEIFQGRGRLRLKCRSRGRVAAAAAATAGAAAMPLSKYINFQVNKPLIKSSESLF